MVSTIVASGSEVFWTYDTGLHEGLIEKWTSAGKPRALVSNLSYPKGLAVGPTDVFWHEDGVIRAVKKTGGAPRIIAKELYINGLFADRLGVYWGAPKEVKMLADGAREPVGLASLSVSGSALMADDDSIYVASALALNAIDRRTRQVRRLIDGDTPAAIAIDGESIYWASGGELHKRPKAATGTDIKISSHVCGRIDSLAVDATHVYMTCHFVSRNLTRGQGFVARARKDGGCPEAVVSGLDWPRGIAVVDGAVIYADKGVVRVVP